MRVILAAVLVCAMSAAAAAKAPLCQHVETGEMVQCWNAAKIDTALAILAKRSIRVDLDYVVSIEMNRGKFRDAKALAYWIQRSG